jgi:hypothetical protein
MPVPTRLRMNSPGSGENLEAKIFFVVQAVGASLRSKAGLTWRMFQ